MGDKLFRLFLAMERMPFRLTEKFYYGWVIVGLSLISMSFWFGIRTTFSLFFVAFIDHFHWGRAETAGAQSIAMFVYMIMSPIIGTLVDRIGPRKVILPGIILTGLGLFLCTQIQTLIQFYLFFGVIVGMGVTCLSIAPFTVILARWFERRRGTANGLAGAGIGLGILILVPMIQYFISSKGWQFAYLILSLLILAIPLPLNALFLKHRPQEIGLLPDGHSPNDLNKLNRQKIQSHEDFNPSLIYKEEELGGIFKTARFWYIIFYPSLTTFGVYIIIVHHVIEVQCPVFGFRPPLRFFHPSLQSLTPIASAGCALSGPYDLSPCRPDSSCGTASSNPGSGSATASAPLLGSLGSHCPLTASPSAISSYVSFDIQDRYNTPDEAQQDGE